MKLIEDIKVGQHFNVVIAYGDTSGLDAGEEDQYDQWFSRIKELWTAKPYLVINEDEEIEFTTCAITGLLCDCLTVQLFTEI